MKNRITLVFAILLLVSQSLLAQQTPAAAQSQAILITGAKAYLANGKVIENSVIAFDNGKLTIVGDANTKIDRSQYQVIDATGKNIYPGFIATNTRLGLVEIDAVGATNDAREFGTLNPSMRAIIAYNTDSRITPTIRSNGILMAQVVPSGGTISGQSSVVQLDAWNWEDAAFQLDQGMHLHWPRMFSYRGWRSEPGGVAVDKNYKKNVQKIEDLFNEALAYGKNKNHKERNLKLEALSNLFTGQCKLFVHTNNVKTITESVLFAKQYNINVVIVGGRDAWMVPDFLKENKVPVVLREVHNIPSNEDAAVDEVYKTPLTLQNAGVDFCFSMNGSWQQRNLPFQAGSAIAYGLSYEDAVDALTINAAKILGIDQQVGSLEMGKDATLFICAGDALDMRTCKVEKAFIQGREIDLDNKQKALYRKFKTKYGQK